LGEACPKKKNLPFLAGLGGKGRKMGGRPSPAGSSGKSVKPNCSSKVAPTRRKKRTKVDCGGKFTVILRLEPPMAT